MLRIVASILLEESEKKNTTPHPMPHDLSMFRFMITFTSCVEVGKADL